MIKSYKRKFVNILEFAVIRKLRELYVSALEKWENMNEELISECAFCKLAGISFHTLIDNDMSNYTTKCEFCLCSPRVCCFDKSLDEFNDKNLVYSIAESMVERAKSWLNVTILDVKEELIYEYKILIEVLKSYIREYSVILNDYLLNKEVKNHE